VRRVVLAALAALLLAGCASSPQADLNRALTTVTERANAQDSAGLRAAVDDLIALVNRQSGSDLPLDEADRIRADAQRVLASAALLDAPVVTPTPSRTTASPTPSRTPSATPSATPSPTPSATPSPSPSPSPSPTRSPAPTASPSASPTRSATPTASNGNGNGNGENMDDDRDEARGPTSSTSPDGPDD
jgi:outer membrane murein-binding lipoprotein Lpp